MEIEKSPQQSYMKEGADKKKQVTKNTLSQTKRLLFIIPNKQPQHTTKRDPSSKRIVSLEMLQPVRY